MRKIFFVGLFAVFVLGLSGCNQQKQQELSALQQKLDQALQENQQLEIKVTELEEEVEKMKKVRKQGVGDISEEIILSGWSKYQNDNLGFVLNYPEQTDTQGKVEIIESGNVVYIVTNKKGDYDYASLQKKTDDFEQAKGVPWAILVQKAESQDDVDSFIKKRYGSGCSIGEIRNSYYENTKIIRIKGDGKDLDETQCPVNYITEIRYSPTLKRVAAWDIGQAYNFAVDGKPVDEQMISSFLFLP